MTDKSVNASTSSNPNTFISATGASLKCDLHNISTFDLNEWNAHCSDPANGHTESGSVKCIDCPNMIEFEGLPYVPMTPRGKDIQLRCDECFNTYVETNRALRGVKSK